jgi:hypothetical protein
MSVDRTALETLRAAALGDDSALFGLADRLEEVGHEAAGLARDLAGASPACPADLPALTEPWVLARGASWRVEYRPGPPGGDAEVMVLLSAEAPEEFAAFSGPRGDVSATWLRDAFAAGRLNLLSHFLLGHPVAGVEAGRPGVRVDLEGLEAHLGEGPTRARRRTGLRPLVLSLTLSLALSLALALPPLEGPGRPGHALP